MADDQSEVLQRLTTQFIELANTMKDEGVAKETVSAALMSASSFYATYAIAGNNGTLNEEGVEKLTAAYGGTLRQVQDYKRSSSSN